MLNKISDSDSDSTNYSIYAISVVYRWTHLKCNYAWRPSKDTF